MQDSQAHLLGLPQELRDMIYEYIFAADYPIVIWGTIVSVDDGNVSGVGLLRACKQLYCESEPLLYSRTTFSLEFEFTGAKSSVFAMQNVVAGYSERANLVDQDGVLISMENGHFPIQKLRKLELRLYGAKTDERYPKCPVELAKHLHVHLGSFINNCSNLQHLNIKLSGWRGAEKKLFCTDVLLAKMENVRCTGSITIKARDQFRRARVEYTGAYNRRLRRHTLWYGEELGHELDETVDRSYEARIVHILSKWTEKTVKWI